VPRNRINRRHQYPQNLFIGLDGLILLLLLGTEKEELYHLAMAFTKTTAHVAAKIAPPEDAHQREAGEMSPGR
jgi:hypothetical protein